MLVSLPAPHLHSFRNSIPSTSPSSLFFPFNNSHEASIDADIPKSLKAEATAVHHPTRRLSSPSAISPTHSHLRSKAPPAHTRTPISAHGKRPSGPRAPITPPDLPTNIDWRSQNTRGDMSQEGRQGSATLTNATRPTPYVQRNLPRRPPPNQRRPSLPALRSPDVSQSDREPRERDNERPRPLPPPPGSSSSAHTHATSASTSARIEDIAPFDFVSPPSTGGSTTSYGGGSSAFEDDEGDIYSRLSTFTFGDAQSPSASNQMHSSNSQLHFGTVPIASSSSPFTATDSSPSRSLGMGLDEELVSPLDRTPRPSIAHISVLHRASSGSLTKTNGRKKAPKDKDNGWSSPSDEEDRRRLSNRSKMRAIDDGSRRPSLPLSNSLNPQAQAQHSDPTNSDAKGKSTASFGQLSAASPSLSSPSSVSVTDDNGLDTDLDFIPASEDSDRRKRRTARYGFGESAITAGNGNGSGSGVAFGGYGFELDFDERIRLSEERLSNEQERSELSSGAEKERKDSAMTIRNGRRGSLPLDRPYLGHSSSSRSQTSDSVMDVNAIAPWDSGPSLSQTSTFSQSSSNKTQGRADADEERETFDPQSLAQLRRPSRSMDDDLSLSLSAYAHRRASRASAHSHGSHGHHEGGHGGGMGMAPSSEPDMRGVAMAQALVQAHLDAQAQQQQQSQHHHQSSQVQNVNHNLGLSIDPLTLAPASYHTSQSSPGASTSPDIEEVDAYQGLDLNYILSGSHFGSGGAGGKSGSRGNGGGVGASDTWSVGRLSVGSSIIARDRQGAIGAAGVSGSSAEGRQREPSWVAGWGITGIGGISGLGGLVGGRRQSTATVNDDTFLRFVKKHDFSYDERKREWTFAREWRDAEAVNEIRSASGLGHSERRAGQEIWRCLWVGRYRVDRVQSKNADPSKPLQIRLNVRHLPDPYSKAGSQTAAGPLTFIHKHSRAQAFSIFRGHSLPQRHLKTSSSILLAPKKVQEQFTSTRTTSKLSTHGLLEDKDRDRERDREREREREREKLRKEREREREMRAATQAGSTSSVSGHGTLTSAATGSTNMTSASEPAKLRLRIEADSSNDRSSLEGGRSSGQKTQTSPESGGVTPSSARPSTSSSLLGVSLSSQVAKESKSSPSDVDTPTSTRVPLTLEQEARQRAAYSATGDGSYALSSTNGIGDREPNPEKDDKKRPESSITDTRSSVFSDGSQQFSSAVSAFDQSSIASSHFVQPMSALSGPGSSDFYTSLDRAASMAARGSVGSIDDQPIRTSHAEAFAALEQPYIDYLRTHGGHYDGDGHDSAPSRFKGLRKLFHPQPLRSGVGKHSPLSSSASGSAMGGGGGAGGIAAVLEGHYTPPWLTMAARSKQEEQERVIKNLNNSFRDVGLLPSFKPNKSNRREKKKKGSENVFDQIPDEALYMLLPMWPGETDPESAQAEKAAEGDWDDGRGSVAMADDWQIPLEERQYLLVYYVANDLSKKGDEGGSKKRTRGGAGGGGSGRPSSSQAHSSQTASAGSASSAHSDGHSRGSAHPSGDGKSGGVSASRTTIALSSFNVLARLVSYRDIHGSGIRIPTQGLSVTGPLSAARRAIPRIAFRTDDLALMIAFCASRERGVEVVPEGAEKLGLCMPRETDVELMRDPDRDAPLTSLGRAAVEMAWLGALAVMGFTNVVFAG